MGKRAPSRVPLTAAQRWGKLLDRIMVRKGLSNRELTELSGLKIGRVWRWRTGQSLPLPENARVVADALHSQRLYDALVEARSRVCPICGDAFIDNSTQINGMYCKDRCRNTAQARRQRDTRGSQAQFAYARIAVYQKILDKFCRDCEPDGICRDARCAMRPISPLPLSKRNVLESPPVNYRVS